MLVRCEKSVEMRSEDGHVIASAVVGGAVVGFMAGASRVSTGGTVAAAVAELQPGCSVFSDEKRMTQR